MIIRAKTKTLFSGRPLSSAQEENSKKNIEELESGAVVLSSKPRRLVFELTNACNLSCVMCGRNAAYFKPTVFNMEWFKSLEPLMDVSEEVTLMGWGEPTVHPNFKEMLKIIDAHAARKYFCTNGMRLGELKNDIFGSRVDVFAVSVDGADPKTNDDIRRGSSLDYIVKNLSDIVNERERRGLSYPYINFVFCAMKRNLGELVRLVELASNIGIEEVKAVYLTAFDDELKDETLWGEEERIRDVFAEAERTADALGVRLKLPHVPGEDVAGSKLHKDCFVAWRDFFLGSDGYIRPCMSTPRTFFKYNPKKRFEDIWNDPEYVGFRGGVNDSMRMDGACARCYQSSHCNWNRKESFIQAGEEFAPEWKKEG